MVPPDLMAPAARSPILRKDIRPDDLPPPESFSPSPRSREKVGAGAGAVLEEARLAHPQVHDAALVDEVVVDALDEAGVRLRVLVGGIRRRYPAGLVIDVVVALARPIDAVGPVQAGVEPLRRVGRGLLGGEHVAELVEEGAGVLLGVEIAALPAPVGPGAGETVEDLARESISDVVRSGRGRVLSAASSGTERHSHEGTEFSSTRFSLAGTPALRKYFWARMSLATWLQVEGTWMPSSLKTIEPSGFLISLLVVRNSIPS